MGSLFTILATPFDLQGHVLERFGAWKKLPLFASALGGPHSKRPSGRRSAAGQNRDQQSDGGQHNDGVGTVAVPIM
jgi:hypothetical protein